MILRFESMEYHFVRNIDKPHCHRMIVNAMLTVMDTIDGMKTVVAVFETGSFTAASTRMGLSKALVSKYVAEVEASLGVRLFNRSTRRLAITEAGRAYYQQVLPLLDELAALADSMSGEQGSAKGLLRVSVPIAFGEMSLTPLVPKFLAQNPGLSLDLQLTDNMIDMLEEGIDVVIRIGSVDESNLVVRELNTFPLILCASPAYLKQHGSPQSAQALLEHNCIVDSNFRIGKQWPMRSANGKREVVNIRSNVSVNSPRAVKELAIASGGIGMIPKFIVVDALLDGSLVEVLPGQNILEFGMYALYPHRRYLAKKVRCFIDFLVENFAAEQAHPKI